MSKHHILILLLIGCGSCIEPFNPHIDTKQEVLAINGFITDRSGPHQVVISRSTPYSDPYFVPVSGCVVTVENETGSMAEYTELYPGVYEADLAPGFLRVGKSYSLFVSTPDGEEYRSEYDQMLDCSPVDSVYYEVMSRGTADPDVTLHGTQIYVDVKGTHETASNYRWLLEETWWYNAAHYADLLWTGEVLLDWNSNFTCNITDTVRGFFSASTRNLSVNHLNRNPLHYVSNQTPRLKMKYSVLVKQHSLSDQAYDYWVRMESQSTEGIAMHESQPSSTVGNIYNVNDPAERVVGCFYATQVREKRLTFTNQFDFHIEEYDCPLDTIQDLNGLVHDLPYYVISLDPTGYGGPPYLIGAKKCFDCTLYGGTTTEPGF